MYVSFDIRIKDKNYPRIGSDIRMCPHCARPLSWAYGHYFCRGCQAEIKKTMDRYKKVVKEAN